MSKFYGTLQNERGGESTRTAHKSIRASAQSYNGSVIVELSELNGETMFEIRVGSDSTAYGDMTILQGKLSELLNARGIIYNNIAAHRPAFDTLETSFTPEQ